MLEFIKFRYVPLATYTFTPDSATSWRLLKGCDSCLTAMVATNIDLYRLIRIKPVKLAERNAVLQAMVVGSCGNLFPMADINTKAITDWGENSWPNRIFCCQFVKNQENDHGTWKENCYSNPSILAQWCNIHLKGVISLGFCLRGNIYKGCFIQVQWDRPIHSII